MGGLTRKKSARLAFHFDETKAVAAAARIVRFHGGAMDLIRLVKLMYLAERESLRIHGHPIFGDRYFAMEHGPVVSHTYDLLKGAAPSDGHWTHAFETVAHSVRLIAAADETTLSQNDMDVIDRVCEEHRQRNTWALVELTHRLPEWKSPGKTSVPIPCETLLRALGKTNVEIARLREEEDASAEFDALFAKP
jgi:uncharacterized phage-associated protein